MNKKEQPFEEQPPLFDPEDYNPVPAWEFYDDLYGHAKNISCSEFLDPACVRN